ncbi:hypothetical protein LOK74_03345 [Brevibacillus humidisoli]|uniref:hypothetical protein n=1 Tax=Brevibacillus humidisoli TaxID=2895522 RepID=UPI001E50654F|nr:hypothetical protein [Brevibacillus humidisoli]UFJ41580.1 hypothetical protein LOK74_03345 [Brevibacillus humidisoli]
MSQFDLSDLEKIHLALDMAQRFVRGESYHGDKPKVLLLEFERIKERVHEKRRALTQSVENAHRLTDESVQDADFANQNPPL